MAQEECCRREQLCAPCLEESYADLAGLAASLGARWAGQLSRVYKGPLPFERFTALAILKAAVLADDQRLITRLARDFLEAARSEWRRTYESPLRRRTA